MANVPLISVVALTRLISNMHHIKLTKKDKMEIALTMIYHSIDSATFSDSFHIPSLSDDDEVDIFNNIEHERGKILKRIKSEVINIIDVNEMVMFFRKDY